MTVIRCWRRNCKFNRGGWCELSYIEIDENGVCLDYEPRKVSADEGRGAEA